MRRRIRSSAPNTGFAVFSRLKVKSLTKIVSRYYDYIINNLFQKNSNKACYLSYLENFFRIICIHMPSVDSIVKLLELKQILMYRTECAHPIILTDISEEHHSNSFVAFLNSCPLVLLVSEFAESDVMC